MDALLVSLLFLVSSSIAAFLAFRRGGVYNPPEDAPEPRETPVKPPVIETLPPEPPPAPQPQPAPVQRLDFSTPKTAFKSTRILCDIQELSYEQKNVVCATIFGESEFDINAVNDNGKSKDHSLCQFNDGPPGVPPEKKWYIGPGKLFKDVADVYANPERQVLYMIDYLKTHGHLNPWYAYKHGRYKQFLPKTSRMWKLR